MTGTPAFGRMVRVMVVAVTVVFSALALVAGRSGAEPPPALQVGEASPQTFFATAPIAVEDPDATARAREEARLQVQTVYSTDVQVSNAVLADIRQFYSNVREAAKPVPNLAPDVADEIGDPVPPAEEEPAPAEEQPPEDQQQIPAEGETTTSSSTSTSTTTTTLPPRPREEQSELLAGTSPQVPQAVREQMLDILNVDLERIAAGEPGFFSDVELEALEIARELLQRDGGILATELDEVQRELITAPPPVLLPGVPTEARDSARVAIAELVATFLQANKRVDADRTNELRDAAAAAQPPELADFVFGETIVNAGDVLTEVHVDAIEALGLLQPEEDTRLEALAVVAALAVILSMLFLWRVARRQWDQPKQVGLFGLLIVLAALAARLPEILPDDPAQLRFVIPAAMFGFLAAILFDSRAGALMAIPVATFTGLATGDAGVTIFAAGATMAPVPFVSAVSSRRQLRLAVLTGGAVLAPLAAAIAWFFDGGSPEWRAPMIAALVAFSSGVASGVAAQGLLPFFENLFRVTTTLTLLDLTDRNHPGLRLIEEEAPGTFNHSILVGTLAGKAARAIGANPLLAQAAAYYHDLGKTVRPRYFIENQFGVSNPHDEMTPSESAQIIRSHVTDGLRLARQFGIAPEVAEGIRAHHGTGLMRYFYHRALEDDPGVDPETFRHHGEKPRRKEMAILMLADSVEGATRALVQHEDPTSAGIRKVVDQVINEKMEDGQLDDSALTFGELTKVREALVDALLGYYHTRIPYPGFPGREATAPV